MRRGAIAGVLAFLAIGLLAMARSQAQEPARAAALAAFEEALAVLTHPRCQNCHTQTDYPRQGDERRRHDLNVRRGEGGHGLPAMRCATCHGRSNGAASGVPGAEEWHLAPRSMGWEGLPPGEVCRNLLDVSRNGGRTPQAVVGHVETDPLVRWAWSPGRAPDGRQRAIPPLSHEAFVRAMRAWVAHGAACP